MRTTLLLLFFVLCFSTEALAYDVCVDGIYFNIDNTKKTAEVTSSPSSQRYEGSIIIPSLIVLDNGDFEGRYIVTSIGEDAFYYCSGLTSVTIPNSVTSIGEDAFWYCSGLTSVTIPNSVTSIGKYAFSNCSGLTSITIPNSVTSIGYDAFYHCYKLNSVNINDIAAWCNISFHLNRHSNPLNYAHNLYLNGEKITDLIIPDGVTSISDYAFIGCTGLASVTIPNSVKSIGDWAFCQCYGITSIYLPDCSVEEYTFDGWRNSQKIYCYPKAYNVLSDSYGNKILMGGSTCNVDCHTVTQTTASLSVHEVAATAQVPEGWPTYSPIKEISIGKRYSNDEYVVVNCSETVTLKGLVPYKNTFIKCKITYNDGKIVTKGQYVFTKGLEPAIATLCGPTSIALTGKYQLDDAHIKETYFTVVENGETKRIDGDCLVFTGLIPNTMCDKKYSYHVVTEEGSHEKVDGGTFTTSALKLTTLQPRCVSSTCAIVVAKTNISDDETNVGFQWKKYDAPESLKPNEGFAAIYNGQLEGYIRNLHPTSYYNVRAFYKSAEGKYYYGDWVTFDPSDFSYFEPTVHTYEATEIGSSSAKVKGYVLAGTDDIIEQGFEYWTTGSTECKAMRVRATDENNVSTVFSTGQVMTATFTDLLPSSTYCFRSFVKTASGTTYGEEQTFTTDASTTGIGNVEPDVSSPVVIGYYDLCGRRYSEPKKGLNIIRYSDGSSQKILVK